MNFKNAENCIEQKMITLHNISVFVIYTTYTYVKRNMYIFTAKSLGNCHNQGLHTFVCVIFTFPYQ